jgi:hypothetical protein
MFSGYELVHINFMYARKAIGKKRTFVKVNRADSSRLRKYDSERRRIGAGSGASVEHAVVESRA